MRYYELLEAPLADFTYYGDKEKPGSLRGDDIKAAQNPKWLIKLEKSFRAVHEEVNVVLMNAPNGAMRQTDPMGSSDIVPISLNTIQEWAGVYTDVDFQKHFGVMPKNHKERINIILISNEGGERLPLTPWMIAHRFMHALGNSESRYYRKNSEIFFKFSGAFDEISRALRIIRNHLEKETGKPFGSNDNEMYAKLATFASARNHKIARSGEFIVELATQYFLKGDFDFNISQFNLTEDEHRAISNCIHMSKEHLDECFENAVGKLVVF